MSVACKNNYCCLVYIFYAIDSIHWYKKKATMGQHILAYGFYFTLYTHLFICPIKGMRDNFTFNFSYLTFPSEASIIVGAKGTMYFISAIIVGYEI